MPLSNWTIYRSGNPAVGITTTVSTPVSLTPILGTGSLRVEGYVITDQFVNIYNTTAVEIGLKKGRFRSVLNPKGITGTGTEKYSFGCVFMQSQLNVSGGSGSCYFAHLSVRNGGTNAQFYIRKFVSTGLQGDTLATTTLYSGLNLGTILGQNTAVEVEWDADSGTHCDITIRRALNTMSFGSLILETTVTDSVSPLLTTVGEGIAMTNGLTSGTYTWLCDTTSLKKLL